MGESIDAERTIIHCGLVSRSACFNRVRRMCSGMDNVPAAWLSNGCGTDVRFICEFDVESYRFDNLFKIWDIIVDDVSYPRRIDTPWLKKTMQCVFYYFGKG